MKKTVQNVYIAVFCVGMALSSIGCKESGIGQAADPFFEDQPGFEPDVPVADSPPTETNETVPESPVPVAEVQEEDKFEFDKDIKECINKSGDVGLNVLDNFQSLGQCSDAKGSEIANTNLSQQDLSGSDFTDSLFNNVDLSGSDLTSVNFGNVQFDAVDFHNVVVENTDFTDARLDNSDIEDEKFINHLKGENIKIGAGNRFPASVKVVEGALEEVVEPGDPSEPEQVDLIAKLRAEIKRAKLARKELRQEMRPDLKVVKDANVRIAEKRKFIRSLRKEINQLILPINEQKGLIKSLRGEVQLIVAAIKVVREERNQLHRTLVGADAEEKAKIREEMKALKEKIRGKRTEIKSLRAQIAVHRAEIKKLRIPINSVKAQINEYRALIADERTRIADNRTRLKSFRQQLKALRELIKEKRNQIKAA